MDQLTNTFDEIINGYNFKNELLLTTRLNEEILNTEEFRWYSKINIAIDNGEKLSDDEKIHFLAMHRTFLMLLNN